MEFGNLLIPQLLSSQKWRRSRLESIPKCHLILFVRTHPECKFIFNSASATFSFRLFLLIFTRTFTFISGFDTSTRVRVFVSEHAFIFHAALQQISADVLDCIALMSDAAPCRPARPNEMFPKFRFTAPSERERGSKLATLLDEASACHSGPITFFSPATFFSSGLHIFPHSLKLPVSVRCDCRHAPPPYADLKCVLVSK